MKNFHRDDRSGSRGDRDSRRPTTMYQTTCASCGQKCEVPFRPTGERPVYCSACFDKSGRGDRDSRPGNKRFDRPSFGDRPKFQAVCDKCGKKCEVPFRPTGDKPIYCDDCFDKGGTSKTRHVDNIRHTDYSGDQLAGVNAKLDRILALLSPETAKSIEEKKPAAPIKEEKPVAKTVKPEKEKKTAVKAKPAAKKKVAKKKK